MATDADDTTCHFVRHLNRLNSLKARRVVEYASKTVAQLNHSEEFQQQNVNALHVPLELHHSQIQLGELLGQGTFSDVFEIKGCTVQDIEPHRFAVKVLREKMIDDPMLFASSAAGLATEATILSLLDHENIIGIKAWSHRGLCGYSNGTNDAFFIVIDRLDEILSTRLENWKYQADKLRFSVRQRQLKIDQLFRQRLQVGCDIAGGLSYLHERRIIHRDLKPANIGFQNGLVKLLDFDVSRFLPKESAHDQLFNLTALTGTRRYMSPENGLHEPYNQMTDVYSFAILLDEMIAMEKAFPNLTKHEHEVRVFRHGLRPSIPQSCPKRIRRLIQNSWAREIDQRPSMEKIHEILEAELGCLREKPTSLQRNWFQPMRMPKLLPPTVTMA